VKDFPAVWEIKNGRAGKLGDLPDRCFPVEDLSVKEVFPGEISTRYYMDGVWHPIENKAPWADHLYYQSSYDNAVVRAEARKTWQRVRDLKYLIGQFRWGSFDYLGETNNWPSRCANFGIIDVAGIPKDHYYLYKSLWTEDPMVHMLPHWTHPGKSGRPIPVVVYTNCEKAELFLNGNSMGKKIYDGEQLVWHVPYQPGTIRVEGSIADSIAAVHEYKTAGAASACRLIPDKDTLQANGTDVTCVLVEITDGRDILCPDAGCELVFQVSGPARIIGVDNGDPLDLSGYKTNRRKAFRGKAILLLQAERTKGEVKVVAGGEDIEPRTTIIQVR
jgi:beta-galactosidase